VYPGLFLNAKIAFFFYLVAGLCFVVAALLPAGRGPAILGRINLIAFGLALAIAPTVYVYFKAGFHQQPIFH
jgi:hypothetical protein